MSPPPSFYLQPEHEHRRRTRTRTHDISTRSSSLASTLRSPTTNINVDSLGKPHFSNQTQHRPHQSHHSGYPSHSTGHKSNKPESHSRSSSTFPPATSLTSGHPLAPTRLPPFPPYSTFSPENVSRASTLISTQPPPIALAFLNLLDDLGILLLCKPLLELCNVEWISLFDDMGIFYLCEPIGAIRRVLRKVKIGRVDRQRGGGSCLGSKSSKSSKDTWERDTMSWISSLVSERRSSKRSGSSGSSETKKSSIGGRRSRARERQSTRDMMKNKRIAESVSETRSESKNGISGIGSRNDNGSISAIGSGSGSISAIGSGSGNKSKNESTSAIKNKSRNTSISGMGIGIGIGIGNRRKNAGGSITASERISGTNRRRNERAASSVAPSYVGESLKGVRREKYCFY